MNNEIVPLRERDFDQSVPVCVSICCITFNHRPYIEACLEGFLDQRCDFRVEIVIHDDASNDGTAEVIREYSARYPTIFRPIFQQDNQYSKGVNPYYAYVFPAAHGSYIAICDGDDFWADPNKLAMQVAVLEADPGIVITYGPVKAFNADGPVHSYRGGKRRDLTPEELKAAAPINTLTTCFRNIFNGASPPPFLRNSPIGDLTVWGMLGHHGSGRYLPDLLPAHYRLHEGGILSLVPHRQQLLMTALAQINLSGYHELLGDDVASRRALSKAVHSLNGTGLISLAENSDFSLLGALALWRKGRRSRRKAAS